MIDWLKASITSVKSFGVNAEGQKKLLTKKNFFKLKEVKLNRAQSSDNFIKLIFIVMEASNK
jgi:hypothetical protein